ncbi:MAG: hypothetical protein IKQ33_01735 [Clostridia bacterium]|nr:hypothetical protein [Clostridia bacterium]
MNDLIVLLDTNNIKYEIGDYAGIKSIVIKKNKHKIKIYIDNKRCYVSDLQKMPYTWGRMSSTTLEEIIKDLKDYLGIDIKYNQTNIFDFIRSDD